MALPCRISSLKNEAAPIGAGCFGPGLIIAQKNQLLSLPRRDPGDFCPDYRIRSSRRAADRSILAGSLIQLSYMALNLSLL
jgi:hypothetical protein